MSTALLNLLFAQTIYNQACENDAEDLANGKTPGTTRSITTPPTQEQFKKLAQDLKKHPLNTQFDLGPEACKSLYSALLPSNPSRPTENMLKPLMAKLYESYKRDIMAQIRTDEQEYKKKLDEVEQIEQGQWDSELMKEINLEPESQQDGDDEAKDVENGGETDTNKPGEEPKAVTAEQDDKDDKDTAESHDTGLGPNDRDRTASIEPFEKEASVDSRASKEEDDDDETGRKRKRRTQSPSNKKFQTVVAPLLSNISANKSASFFKHPVSASSAPNYPDLIYSPTDLKTIKAQVKDGSISTIAELERELEKMFANAVMFNPWYSDVSKWAREMQLETESYIAMFRSVERNGRSASGTPVAKDSDENTDTKRRKK